MKMIRNKIEAGSTAPHLIFLVGILVIGVALRSRGSAGGALAEWTVERFRALLRAPIFVRELRPLAGFAEPWLRDLLRATALRFLAHVHAVPKDARTGSRRGAA